MSEVVHLKDAGVRAFLNSIRMPLMNHVYDPHFFSRFIRTAIQYGGLEPRDIAELVGVATVTVLKWKEDENFVPRLPMRRAVCRELRGILEESLEGRSARDIVAERLESIYGPEND